MQRNAKAGRKLTATLMAAAMLMLSNSAYSADTNNQKTAASEDTVNVLVFWGSWCGSCNSVMKSIEALRKTHAGKNVKFTAVSLSDEENPQAYMQKNQFGFDVQTNGSELMTAYDIPGVPWVVVTDKNGKVLANPSKNTRPSGVADNLNMDLALRGA